MASAIAGVYFHFSEIMQLLINVLALSSFIVSGAIVGGGYYIYSNKEAIIDTVKAQVMAEVTGGLMPDIPALGGADLPIAGDSVVPGGVMEAPASIPAIPSFN